MRRLIAIATVLGAVVAAVVLSGAAGPLGDGNAKGTTYYIEFDNAFGLSEGGDLRVGNVNAGKTTDFTITRKFPVKALAEVHVTRPGFVRFREDASCAVRQQSLIGEYYVDCQPGSAPKLLPDGGVIPVAQTSSTIPEDLIRNIQRRPYREKLRLILAELGTGLAGRPEDLSEVLRRAHPGLRETSKVLRTLSSQNTQIKRFIRDSDTVVRDLERKKTEVTRWVDEAGRTAEISASRKRNIEANFRSLPPFLDELRGYMVDVGNFADEQTPLLVDLRRAAPDLETTFAELGPFARKSRPALRSLGQLSDTGREAIVESREEIDAVRLLAKDLPRLARPLRQFLQTLDDRDRSVEDNPIVAGLAPPAPDKTAGAEGKSYTGFEAFWRYLYDQTLVLNGFDDVSHFLRITIADTDCSPYTVKPDKELRDRCNQYLGPYQPGVTDPDPTENRQTGGQESRSSTRSSRATRTRGASARRPERGSPERRAPRGRPDPSNPQMSIPPELQRLLRQKGPAARRGAPAPGQAPAPAPDQLLDYLMAP